MNPRLARTAAFLAGLVAFGIHAWSYRLFVADDAYISLRYARNLVDGHGLVWNPGEAVEGYSNLAWVLVSAAAMALGLDPVLAIRGFGVLCAVLTLSTLVHRAPSSTGAAVAGLAFAASATVAAWCGAGLEQPLLAYLVVFAATRPFDLASGIALGVAAITRPDGILLAAAVVVAARPRLAHAVPVAVAFLGQLAFRKLTYGAWVPNTAHAKLAFGAERLEAGVFWVGEALWHAWPLALGAVFCARRAPRPVVTALTVWLGWVVLVGGDSFPVHRPLYVAFALLAAVVSQVPAGRTSAVAAVLGLGIYANHQATWPSFVSSRYDDWVERARPTARRIGEAFAAADPLLAAETAGVIPYESRLRALDILGLNDAVIAAHPPPDYGQGIIGHELRDTAYVLARRPDLVTLSGDDHPFYPAGRELIAEPAFVRDYRMVWFADGVGRKRRLAVFVRLDGTAGVHAGVVPGYLLTGEGVIALWGGGFAARIPGNGEARLSGVMGPVERVDGDGVAAAGVDGDGLWVRAGPGGASVREVRLGVVGQEPR